MIPIVQNRDVKSSGVEGSASFEISTDNAAHIMTILRDTLYSDKVLAVLREYAANAWDANREAGRADKPIKITLPTYADPTLKIRDNGPGLSMDSVFKVYNQYGSSTKRNDNVAVGMLGIGSKSGFAYSDSFTIVSWHGGFRSTYVAVIDDSEKGRVDLLDIHELSASNGEDVSETGVEIQIPVKPHDTGEFETKAKALFSYFEPRPDINVVLPQIQKGNDFPGLGRIIEQSTSNYYSRNSDWIAVMGCIPYKINLSQLSGLGPSAHVLSGILWFDVGTLQFSASREELKYGDSTKAALTERINSIIDKYIEHLLSGIDELTPWARRLRIRQIRGMRLSVPGTLKAYDENYIAFNKNPAFIMKSQNYRGKISTSDGFSVSEDVRLVFRDDKRMLTGYTLKQGDFIVDPILDNYTARAALSKQLIDQKLDGITVIKITSLPWSRPVTAPRQVDTARSRAACLTLNVADIKADKKSERWTPVTRVPLDTDVYVILNSYVPDGYNGSAVDFYELFEEDRKMLEAPIIGGKMPTIIGYRNTQATPVNMSKVKGTPYKDWRVDGYVKLLLNNKNVADGVTNRTWSDVRSSGTYDHHLAKFDVDHPVRIFMEKVLKGVKDYGKIGYEYGRAISFAYSTYGSKLNTAAKQWDELAKLYPMLYIMGAPSIQLFSGTTSEYWIDYIKMVDIHRKMSENSINEETSEKKEAA